MSRHDLTSSAAAKSHNKTEVWMYQRKSHQAKNISFLEIDRLLYVFQSSPKGFLAQIWVLQSQQICYTYKIDISGTETKTGIFTCIIKKTSIKFQGLIIQSISSTPTPHLWATKVEEKSTGTFSTSRIKKIPFPCEVWKLQILDNQI